MSIQKFGVKLFFNTNGSYSSKDFVHVFNNWIQNIYKVSVGKIIMTVLE